MAVCVWLCACGCVCVAVCVCGCVAQLGAGGLAAYDFEDLCRHAGQTPSAAREDSGILRLNDFRMAMLTRLGKVSRADTELIDAVFAGLDRDGSGVLEMDKGASLSANTWKPSS